VRNGLTQVKLQGSGDPLIELEPSVPREGDRVRAERFRLRVRVTGGAGDSLRLVADGAVHSEVAIGADPFEHEVLVTSPAEGETRWRAEVWTQDGDPRTITSHLWANYLAGVGEPLPQPPSADSGCGCRLIGSPPPPWGWALALGALVPIVGRRRRTRGACVTR
jgi:MYXO-CTERM domain-containing protein